MENITSVSYTHLDVYKRQRLEWDEENQTVWIWAEISSIEPVVVEFEISEDDFPQDGNGSSVSVASFIPGDYIQLGQYANVPIVWRFVGIDENGMLLLSDRTPVSYTQLTISIMDRVTS